LMKATVGGFRALWGFISHLPCSPSGEVSVVSLWLPTVENCSAGLLQCLPPSYVSPPHVASECTYHPAPSQGVQPTEGPMAALGAQTSLSEASSNASHS
jgi:hypothetical protein